ncbi:MAG: glycosyltransferase [Bacteroidales bacterium]|nr:glycosyltransferase [Bacteroidales bacterium]
MGKLIKVAFVDFEPGFEPEKSLLYRMLLQNYQVELSKEPDYVFYSNYGERHLCYDCVRIFYTRENISPDFNFCDYAIGLDYVTLGDRYFRFPAYYLDREAFAQMNDKTYFTSDNIRSKGCFCGFHFGLDEETPERELFFKRLSEYRAVESGGPLYNTLEGVVSEKLPFLSNCKFSIAFEECSQPGYTSDVLMQAFAAQTIPIYWGNPFIGREFNTQAFVNCHDFRSWSEVIEAIRRIDQNDELYLKMMRTPALTGPERDIDRMEENLLAFLSSIFDQPLERARRRSRSAARTAFEKRARIKAILYQISPLGWWEGITALLKKRQ